MPVLTAATIASFRRRIFAFYARYGRTLPFRQTADPYAIAVSEFMLQQTQVARVLPKYQLWLTLFPNWQRLAQAKPVEVLRAWSGLGYNRRALYLHALAKAVVSLYGGVFPDNEEALRGLHGLGPYTRRAILIFSFNAPIATVDTNIRRVLIASFGLNERISASALQAIAERVLPRRRSREWHYALMDYGALKLTAPKSGVRSLSRQSKFEGSVRQVRGAIVRLLSEGKGISLESLIQKTNCDSARVFQALKALLAEKLIEVRRKRYIITAK